MPREIEMKKAILVLLAFGLTAAMSIGPSEAQDGTADARPARINKAIEMLEKGQPVYYTTSVGGYEEGQRLASTTADYINYDMEHGAADMRDLREFMQGLVDAGPTASGHRTPAVIVTLPVLGLDEASMRANYWVIHQALAAGVHGILLCHVREAEAAEVFVAASRYPFAPEVEGIEEGLRGSGSQGFASRIWGVSQNEYLAMADPWPLNPNGELLLGVKIEDRHALENAEATTAVPGIAFAEWGPGDMGFSLVGLPRPGAQQLPEMQAARERVFQATRDNGIFMLHACNENNVTDRIDEGVMICSGGSTAGREYTNR